VKLTVYEKIEELRLELQNIAQDKSLTDKIVVEVSEKLDVLINEFYLVESWGYVPYPTSILSPQPL